MEATNSQELLLAAAHWLAEQDESMSFGLRSAFDALRLYEYWLAHPELPEFADMDADDPEIDVAEHRVAALGYDPMGFQNETEASVGALAAASALMAAEQLLESVVFVKSEGDTKQVLQLITDALPH